MVGERDKRKSYGNMIKRNASLSASPTITLRMKLQVKKTAFIQLKKINFTISVYLIASNVSQKQ